MPFILPFCKKLADAVYIFTSLIYIITCHSKQVLSFLLLIPSVLGYFNTRVNYDILYYLPSDIDTMQGQDILLDDFGKGAYAMVVVDGMNKSNVSKLVKNSCW